MRIIFAGTPEFGVASLRALIADGHTLCMVLTQPDRPAGRGRKIRKSPIKMIAEEYALPIDQPKTLKSRGIVDRLRSLQPDVMVVAAYGLILPQAVLDVPRFGCLNIHASLLPRWRGAAPIQRAILAGDTETGITIMQMSAGLDTGDILLARRCPIRSGDTAQSLHERVAELGAGAIIETLHDLVNDRLTLQPQNENMACYANKLDKSEADIDWTQSAVEIDRKVRALNPWPVARTQFEGKSLRIWQTMLAPYSQMGEPGKILAANREGIDVLAGEGVLRLVSLQLPGGRRIHAADFANAHSIDDVRLPS
jgi:methionyl-tRNA formyltransferase